jgi:PilZ domain
MATPRDTDERRSKRHARGGLVCEFWIGGTRYTGTVKDVSSGGLFIHTSATAAPGTAITLVFAPALDLQEVRFTARVVRSEQIRPDLHSEIGIGVEVLQPGALERVMGDLGRIERAGATLGGSKKRPSR